MFPKVFGLNIFRSSIVKSMPQAHDIIQEPCNINLNIRKYLIMTASSI